VTAHPDTAAAPVEADVPFVDLDEMLQIMEYYADRGWTDGLPVFPATESYVARFLAKTDRDPDEVLLAMPHLNRECTVRLAAVNAALAGCRPEYFPVVLAGWAALREEGAVTGGIWQSTTGTAPLLIVNGPIRTEIGLNSKGNVFGSGFRANATIGRAVRLAAINVFGLRPHQLDQATQGTPAKYTACIAENEEDSPWAPLHTDWGFDAADSTVTSFVIRSSEHVEARHTSVPEQLAKDLADTLCRTGALIHETNTAVLVLCPEHARLFHHAGWSKADLQQFLYEHALISRAHLAEVGKDAVSHLTRWRLAADHPDAVPDESGDPARALKSPDGAVVMVAGANNAGVSAVLQTLRPRGGPLHVTRI
jgi:hypothetical protein